MDEKDIAEQAYNKGYADCEKVLYKAVEWIVKDCNEDICQICAYLREYTAEEINELPDDVELCEHRRNGGCNACIKGIIEKFGGGIDNVGKSYEQGKLDAAKEIFKKVYGFTAEDEVGTRYLIRELALEYGVELPKMPRKGLNGFEVKK